ncbi:MAG: transcriptional regulator [Nitrospirae bacterium]|nr:transcriptional regulator [Nitrospirota bacterium]
MKVKPKKPFVPVERKDTLRHGIIALIEGNALTAKEISAAIKISEKEVYEHLEHIRMTLNRHDRRLSVSPAECKKCGFIFEKREKLKKPGKCPECKGESIYYPVFNITANRLFFYM